jgi:hypothetical protein
VIDSTLAYSLDLYRLDASTRAKVLEILNRLEKDLIGQLSQRQTTWGKQRINQLLKEARDTITKYYKDAQLELNLTTDGLAQITAKATQKAIQATASVSVGLPTETVLSKIAGDAILMGATQASWWAKQEADTAFRFSAAVRQGLVAGETNAQIIARIMGKQGFPSVMDISRANAAALVQTSVQTVANDARLETFKANSDVIKSLEWMATLDGHTCIICAARDGMEWDNPSLDPIDGALPFLNPPLHFNDRCVLVGRTIIDKGGMRASSIGPVDRKTTFSDFLDRMGPEYQNEVLGKGRAQLWRDGKLTLADLVNGKGNPISLAQLRAKYE